MNGIDGLRNWSTRIGETPASGRRRALGLTALCFALACGGNDPPIPDGLAEAEPQVRTHVEEHLQAAREDPDGVEAWTGLALALEANGFEEAARDALRRLLTLDPDAAVARLHLARLLEASGATDEALDELQQLAATHPDYAPGHDARGRLLLRSGDLDGAAETFERLRELAPDHPAGPLGVAEVHLQRGKHQQAVQELETVLRRAPGFRRAHYLLGLAYRGLGRLEAADPLLRSGAGAAQPTVVDDWAPLLVQHAKGVADQVRLAGDLMQAGRLDEAAAVLETARHWNPDNVELAVNLAVVYRRSGRTAEARQLLASQLEAHPRRWEVHLNLAAVDLDLGELDRALAAVDAAAAISPEVAQVHRTRGKILESMGQREEALAAFLQASARAPEDGELRLETARAALLGGDLALARRLCEESLNDPHYRLATYLCLGETARRSGQLEEAETALSMARSLAPDHPDVASLARRLSSTDDSR